MIIYVMNTAKGILQLADVQNKRAGPMYGFVSARTVSKGRYGRTKNLTVDLSPSLRKKLENVILMNFDVAPAIQSG